MSQPRRVCERCAGVYHLSDSYLEETLPDGRRVKVHSADSYRYCRECLEWLTRRQGHSP